MKQIALEHYRNTFARFIKENDPTGVQNSNREHAHILLEELIKSAESTIYIQCTRFAEDVYTPVLKNTINDAINRGCSVSIAVRESIAMEKIQSLCPEVNWLIKVNTFPHDYCVVDEKRFRVEFDEENREALAYAYNPAIGKNLAAVFNITIARQKAEQAS